jgi:hypothetical protein
MYNAAMILRDRPGELSAQGHLGAWAVNVIGMLTAASRVLPTIAQRGSGRGSLSALKVPEELRDHKARG